MFRLNKKYLLLALLLFIAEVVIALFFHDKIIRPYGGDFLVVILLYCFVRGLFNISVMKAAVGVLIFSFLVETLQYFRIVHVLGLQESKVARIIIGSSFEWLDLVAYCGGITLVLLLEFNVSGRAQSLFSR